MVRFFHFTDENLCAHSPGKLNIFLVQTSLRRTAPQWKLLCMLQKRLLIPLLQVIALTVTGARAAPKPHVISYGKGISVKWPDASGKRFLDLKVRPLIIDTRVKEYTTGAPHDLTDRLFVIRRAFRLNDALPE